MASSPKSAVSCHDILIRSSCKVATATGMRLTCARSLLVALLHLALCLSFSSVDGITHLLPQLALNCSAAVKLICRTSLGHSKQA
jgi:hypothetical protein